MNSSMGFNPGTDDDSGKMLSLQKESDRDWDSSLQSRRFSPMYRNYRDGLYTTAEYEDGKWRIERKPLSQDKYEKAKSVFETIGENGMITKKNNDAYYYLYTD